MIFSKRIWTCIHPGYLGYSTEYGARSPGPQDWRRLMPWLIVL